MIRINIKPFSVNDAWKGRRYMTDDYEQFRRDMGYLLPRTFKVPDGKLELRVIFGFSSEASDNDNPVKTLQDALSEKYNFNDKRIYHHDITKTLVEKGKEFIAFEILPYLSTDA